MANIDVKLNIASEILTKLGAGTSGLWTAAHYDGSDNRIDENAILEDASYDISLGIFSAVFQGIRKAFRNRGKTKEDLLAEKEAAGINKTCAAFDLMLLDYLRETQSGTLEEESLDDLLGTIQEMETYARSGKLKVPGQKELAAIHQGIAEFTAALTGAPAQPALAADAPAAEQFARIRELLTRQKQWLGAKG